MVDIGGYRLHLYCTGKGNPTVVLEYGGGSSSPIWALVQPGISQFTQVCSYDRAYDAFSDAGPIPVTMHQEVYELHLLLQAARIRAPYVLVGHSLGGMINRLYAEAYPSEVAGMVLVDATHEDSKMGSKPLRLSAAGKPVPAPQTMKSSPPVSYTQDELATFAKFEEQRAKHEHDPVDPLYSLLPQDAQQLRTWAQWHPKMPSSAKGKYEDLLAEELQQISNSRQGKEYPLGDIPLVVLGAGRANPANEWDERLRQLRDMAALSRRSRLILDMKSGHAMYLQNPGLVTYAVHDVYETITHPPPAGVEAAPRH